MLNIEGLTGFKPIGSGGFADVYEAVDKFGRRVAVKVLKALDEAGRRRFDRERAAMGRVAGHPHIVTPFTSGYTDDPEPKPYVVMEYLSGGSLQQRLSERGPYVLSEAIELVVSVTRALQHSHGVGIVHKDVKPLNILLTEDGVPKLADFGIAAIRDATQTTSVAYSPEYTPPELFYASDDGQDPRDERSDLYSLASTLYTVLTGRGPFHSTTNNSAAAYMHRILTDPPPSVGHAGMDAFLATAMAKNPADRYRTASQFIDALQAINGSRATAATVKAPGSPGKPQPAAAREVAPKRSVASAVQPHPTPDAALTGPQSNRQELERRSTATRRADAVNGRALRSIATVLTIGVAVAAVALIVAFLDTPSDRAGEETQPSGATYAGHTGEVFAMAGLANGNIASAGADETVQIWDPADPGTTIATYTAHLGTVFAVKELSDGNIVSAGSDGAVRVWDPADPDATIVTYTGHRLDDVWAVVELADGNIASASQDHTVQIWDPADPGTTIFTYTLHTGWVTEMVELADGNIASAAGGTVHIWDPTSPRTTVAKFDSDSGVTSLVELANGNIASAGYDNTVQIWDPADPDTIIATYTGPTNGWVNSVLELANGNIASHSGLGLDDIVQVWDPADPDTIIATYTGHTSLVNAMVELADGNIVSATSDGTVQIWDPESVS